MPDPVKKQADAAAAQKNPRLRAMYDDLKKQADAVRAQLDPAREVYDRKVNDPELVAARKAIKELSAKLAPIEQELAALAKALGTRTLKAEAGVYEGGK